MRDRCKIIHHSITLSERMKSRLTNIKTDDQNPSDTLGDECPPPGTSLPRALDFL